MLYQLLFFLHLVGVSLFLLGHGTSMFLAMALRRERDPARIRAMLDLSLVSIGANYVGLLLLIAAGIWMGFIGQFWSNGWIWAALLVLVATMAFMVFAGVTYFGPVRVAVGLQPYRHSRQVPLGPLASPVELDRLLTSWQLTTTMVVGAFALLVLLWLMVYKPF
ncbi:MAG TPA: hypothetical protein VG894_07955 [Bauldia sp.]|nr:hypothetical protein [Bauldia sp.]